jgi:hypothetical protein
MELIFEVLFSPIGYRISMGILEHRGQHAPAEA